MIFALCWSVGEVEPFLSSFQIIKKQENFRAFDDRRDTCQPFGPGNTSASKLFLMMALQQSRVLARI